MTQLPRKTRKTRRIDPEVYEAIVDLATRTTAFSGPRIYNELKRRFGAARVPSVRTIQTVTREAAPPIDDTGERWSLLTAGPEDARAILPVIADLIRKSNGKLIGIGTPLAEHVARIARACGPDIPATDVLRMAARYVNAAERGASTEYLDAYLALEAWDDVKGKEALDKGWLPVDWWVIQEARND